MSVAEAAVAAGRHAAEQLMADAARIDRLSAPGAFDPATKTHAPPTVTPVYAGRCRVKPTGAGRTVEAGEQPVGLFPYVVSIPAAVTTVALDDVVTITASTLDPALVDLRLRVRSVGAGTHITARRLGCETAD